MVTKWSYFFMIDVVAVVSFEIKTVYGSML